MIKVISITLFGDGDRYAQYLSSFVRAYLNLFPLYENWRLHVHVDNAVNKNRYGLILKRLEEAKLVTVVRMDSPILTRAMLWRMVPAFKDGVEWVFSRDIDACPMPRDRAVCEQFIVSQCSIGTCHDNLAHTGVMGGLSHVWAQAFRRATGFKSLDDLYKFAATSDSDWARHGTDQIVLNRMVDRFSGPFGLKLLEHRFNGWTEGKPTSYRRSAGTYNCSAWSTPTPDEGISPFKGEFAMRADQLANHLGSAGYDHLAVKEFYDAYGDPEITAAVAECEAI